MKHTEHILDMIKKLTTSKMMDNKKSTHTFFHGEAPEGWKVEKIGNIGVVGNGTTPSREIKEYWHNGDIPWLPTGKVNEREIYHADEFITERALKETSLKILPVNTVLIGMIGQGKTRGMTAITKIESTVNQNFAYIICSSQLDPLYLFNKLDFDYSHLRGSGRGGGQESLNCQIIKNYKLLLPPLPEQRAIAACLGAWDEAIQKNNQLIAQKELRKKWLMQQLLTGKRRLKGFVGEWREYHIRDIATELSKKNSKEKDLIVLSCTKYDGLVPSLEYFGRRVFSEDTSSYKVVPKYYFAYATNHIEEGSIGYQDNYEEALISPMYTVFKTSDSINDYFLFKLLKSHRLIHEYNARMEGSIDRRGGLRWDAFSIIKIRLPSLPEQTAIAQVLQTADREVELLKAKVAQLKEQKRGLMQVLLTGKVRLAGGGGCEGVRE